MAAEVTVRRVVERFFEFTGADVARAEELYQGLRRNRADRQL